jgi:predicted transcriptional regulator
MVDPDLSVGDAIEDYFLRYGYGGFPVGANGKVEGLVSLSMVQRCPREERAEQRVRDIMRHDVEQVSIKPDATVSQALQKMTEIDAGRLVVMQDAHLLGLITRSGVSRFVQLKTRLEPPEV